MMLITIDELKGYTSFDSVKNRTDSQLADDIMQAEADVFLYVGHEFDPAVYPVIPAQVKLACKKLAEYYALTALDESSVKGYKSERIGDYSYTMADGKNVSQKPEYESLLKRYIQQGGEGTPTVRLRFL